MSLLAHLIFSLHSFIADFPLSIIDLIFAAAQRLSLLYFAVISGFLLLPCAFLCSYLPHLKWAEQYEAHRRECEREPEFRKRIVLITGVNSIKGLFLARSFYLSGHSVIGADFEWYWRFSPARFSRALCRFCPIPLHLRFGDPENISREYAEQIIDLIEAEAVDLWVSCLGGKRAILVDSQAKQLVEERTRCRCVQFDYQTTARLLTTPRNFFDLIEMDGGLSPLETHRITSTASIQCIQQIRGWSGRDLSQRFILRPARTDNIFDITSTANGYMGPCYLSEIAEQAAHLDISRGRPWVLEQHVCGGQYYRSHALIVHGRLAIFFACPIQPGNVPRPGAARRSRRPGFYHTPLDPRDWLSQAMQEFTETFTKMISGGHDPVTGHLSFDFVLDPSKSQLSSDNLYVLSCSTEVRTAMSLFAPPSCDVEWIHTAKIRAMVQAYLSVLTTTTTTTTKDEAEERSTSSWDSIRPNFPGPRYYYSVQISSNSTMNSSMPPELDNSAHAPRGSTTREAKWHLSKHDSLNYCCEDGDGFPAAAGPSQPILHEQPDDVTPPHSNLPTPPSTPPPTSARSGPPEESRTTTTTANTNTSTKLFPPDSEILTPWCGNGGEHSQLHRYLAGYHLIARVLDPLSKLVTGQLTSRGFYNRVNKLIVETSQWKELAFEMWDPMPFFLVFAYSMADAWWLHSFHGGRRM